MTDFSAISSFYREKSLVQASAGRQLMELLAIPPHADILDVGCGPGNLTAELRGLTSGRVTGIDPSEGMIRQSRELCAGRQIEFRVMGAEELAYEGEFDTIFCSSTFQWFRRPEVALERFRRALRPGGKIGIQSPATKNFSPNFVTAIDHCRKSEQLDALFAGFRPPWFFLDSAAEYRALFERGGFRVAVCRIDEVHQTYAVEEACGVFNSGAAAGYLNQAFFSTPLPPDFSAQVLQGVRESFEEQADPSGEIDVVFHRVYVVAEAGCDAP